MKHSYAGRVLRIYVGDDDKWKGGLLYPAIVAELKQAGIAGVTVVEGTEGYGAHAKLHTARFPVLFQGLPVVIEAVDTPEKIDAVLPRLDEMIGEGLVTLHDVEAIQYRKE